FLPGSCANRVPAHHRISSCCGSSEQRSLTMASRLPASDCRSSAYACGESAIAAASKTDDIRITPDSPFEVERQDRCPDLLRSAKDRFLTRRWMLYSYIIST